MYARHMRRQNRLPSAASWLAVLIASTAPAFAAHDSTSASSGNDLTRQLRRERRRRIAAEEARERAESLLLWPRKSEWQPRRALAPCNHSKQELRPLISALVQTFGDGAANARQLAHRLHRLAPPHMVEVIVNDDSRRDHAEWLRWLDAGLDVVLSLPNVHEIRAYNRMARIARGDFLLLLQGDHCLPPSRAWLDGGLKLFERFPKLGMLGGQMGFDAVPLKKVAEKISWGVPPCKPIPTRVSRGSPRLDSVRSVTAVESSDGTRSSSQRGGDTTTRHAAPLGLASTTSAEGMPFMFVAGVNIGPLLVRREAFLRAGGFDEAFSCAGEPGIQLDTELSLQLWRIGYQVGLWYAGVSNGVGGRKTRKNKAQKRARNLNDAINGQRCERLMRTHDAAAVAAANAELAQLDRPSEARERTYAQLGVLEPSKCAASIER